MVEAIIAAMGQAASRPEAPSMAEAFGGSWTQGDWVVNVAGSGAGATQSAGATLPAGGAGLLWIAAGLGVLWLMTRK